MRNNSPYRAIAALLAVVFALFNVGLPVIIDACPMPKMAGNMTCALCHPLSAQTGGTPVVMSPRCCTPVIAAERNTTAFTQAQKMSDEFRTVSLAVLVPSVSQVVVPGLPRAHPFTPSWSPPGRDADLPVLHSSLLI